MSATSSGSRTAPDALTTSVPPPSDDCSMSVFTPCGHRQLTRRPRSPYVIDEPLGERHGRSLRHAVRRRPDLGQQPGRGRGRAEVAVAASQPLVEQVLGGPPVRIDVDVERELPVLLGRRQVDAATDPGVGEEQVDRPERLLGRADQFDVPALGGHVGDRRRSARSRPAVVPAGSSTSATTTFAPPSWKRRASAAPMPRAAPVTTTLAPLRSIGGA